MDDNKTRTVNLTELFLYVLSKWRTLIAGALIGAVLLGLGGIALAKRNVPSEASLKAAQTDYEKDLKTYETKKEKLQIRISNLENNIAQQQYIEERSVMLEMDPYNIYETVLSYYVDTNYEIVPELYYQDPDYTAVITNSYVAAVKRLDISDYFVTPERPDVLTDNPISGNTERLLSVTSDPDYGTITITARADTQENLDRLTQAIQDTIDETKTLLNRTVRNHTLSVLDSTTRQTVDFDYTELQQSFDDNVYDLVQSLTDASDKLDNLEAPQAPSATSVNMKKEAVKFGIIGLILGLFLVAFVHAFRMVTRDPVLCAEDISERYQVPVLGIYTEKNGKRRSGIDRFVAGKMGIPKADHEESVAYIKATRALYPLEHEILLVSASTPDRLQEISELLSEADPGTKYVTAGDLGVSAAAVNALADAASVICVEKWLKATHEDVKKELTMIHRVVSPEKVAMILIQ